MGLLGFFFSAWPASYRSLSGAPLSEEGVPCSHAEAGMVSPGRKISAPILISLTSPEVVSVFCRPESNSTCTGIVRFERLWQRYLVKALGAWHNQRELTEDCNRNHREIRARAPMAHGDLELAVTAMTAVNHRARENSKTYHHRAEGSGRWKERNHVLHATIPRGKKEWMMRDQIGGEIAHVLPWGFHLC